MPRPAAKWVLPYSAEYLAAELGIHDVRGQADCELGVLEGAPESVASQPHPHGEPEMDRGLERVVPLSLEERFVVERDRPLRAHLDAGQMRQHGCTLDPRCGSSARLFEQRVGSLGVSGAVVQVGCEEQAPAGIVRVRSGRESERLLGEIGGRSRRPASVRRSSCLLQDRGDASIGLRRGEREVPRSFLGRRDDLGEPCVERPAPCRSLACGDSRAEQRMGESEPRPVELENPRVERLGEPGVEARADAASTRSIVGSASAATARATSSAAAPRPVDRVPAGARRGRRESGAPRRERASRHCSGVQMRARARRRGCRARSPRA